MVSCFSALIRRPALGLLSGIVCALATAGPGHLEPAPVAGAQDEPVTQEAIDEAIDRGVQYLLARQELDGSWKPDEHRYTSGQTGLTLYTLLKAGVSSSHPAVRRGMDYLRLNPPEWTYGIACCLLAAHTAGHERYIAEIEAWTEALLDCQVVGFGYGGPNANAVEDLSLSQYGALGLRVAQASGIKVPYRTWESLLNYADRVTGDNGAFTYRPGTAQTGSMTAAGIAVLKIASDALEAEKRLGARERRAIDARIEESVAWLGEHMRMDRNPDPGSDKDDAAHMTRWHLYYLYGLERVGGLTGFSKFGGRDWYKEASEHLVKNQGGKGQWGSKFGESHPGTCFALLVLKRATAPSSGSKPRGTKSYGSDDPKRPVSLRVTGDTPLTVWISSFGERSLEKHEWDDERGDGLRVAKVEYFNPDTSELLATTKGNPEKPSKGERFGAQCQLSRPGKFKIQGRVFVRPLGAEPDETVELLTQIETVEIDAAVSPGMRAATADLGKNELKKTRCTAEASSKVNDPHAPGFAADGTQGYGWLSAPEDASPWIEIEMDRPQKGDHVVLAPYLNSPDDRFHWGRPAKVFLRINGKKVGEFELNEDPFAKTYIPLPKKSVMRRIRVEITEITKGTHDQHGACAGFSEIELQLRPDLKKARKRR